MAMVCTLTAQKTLVTKFSSLSREQATGKLLLASQGEQWQLYFLSGQLLYITGDVHRVRRWSRALRQHSPSFQMDTRSMAETKLWEYHILQRGVLQGQLTLTQGKSILSTICGEILFRILGCSDLKYRWGATKRQPDTQKNQGLPLSSTELEQILQQSAQLREHWREMGLGYLCPDLAPIWHNTSVRSNRMSEDTSITLSKLFNGQNTLWDIALKQKRSVLDVTRTLHHFIKQGEIDMRTTLDLPSPQEQLNLVNAALRNGTQPLIACIDDSITISQSLQHILQPEGYRVLTIQDPLEEMSLLVKHKPDLIFLDLSMPRLNGSDLCAFLKKTAVFKDTPIIILTGSNRVVDRVCANINGASDFLSKPPDPQKVIQLIQKHLNIAPEVVPNMSSAVLA
jgi:two-component system, chemotaxis family, response regulator PixG